MLWAGAGTYRGLSQLKVKRTFKLTKEVHCIVECLRWALLGHEQGQTPDSIKRSYENTPLGKPSLKSTVFTNFPVWGLNKVSFFPAYL